MFYQAFRTDSPYKKRASVLATVWTLLIFIGCFWPGNRLPEVPVPLIDKWAHFVLFGGFAFLWLCSYPSRRFGRLLVIFLVTVALGCLIEELQGLLTFLHRSKDIMDALADSIGGILGIVLFWLCSRAAHKRTAL